VEVSGISKRAFLVSAGAAATAAALGGVVNAAYTAGLEYDLIVVGGGNAGLPTAIFAAQRGANVLVVEAGGAVGGTLFLSSGQMSAAGTRLQKARGIEDTAQSHYDDVMQISKGTADPELMGLAVFNAAAAFDWLMDCGFVTHDAHPITGTTHEPYSRARYAWGPQGGASILKVLNEQLAPHLQTGRVTLLTSHEVVELLQTREGAVTGVVIRDPDGRTLRQAGRRVALTSGGYTANPAMFEKYEGVKTYTRATYPRSQGIGIELGLAAGGYVRGGKHHTPLFGAILADHNVPTSIRAMARHFPPDRPPYEIFVDGAGQRFLCEDVPSHDAYEQAISTLPEQRCWAIYDEAIRRAAPPFIRGGGFGSSFTREQEDRAFSDGTPMFFRADDLGRLATLAGIDPQGLIATVAAYNRGQAEGRDALGRQHMPLPIQSGPFYAVQLNSWNLLSYAGIGVDGRLRVTRPDGAPIPNLYAAGELLGMGQLMGKSLPGGMSVMPAITFGRLLGKDFIDFG
jgi:fumarate reductase flavoprotein subunit